MSDGYGRTYLSYHMFKDYQECGFRYRRKYLSKEPSTVVDIPQYKILGVVWNDMLEVFYKEEKYFLGSGVRAWMREEVERAFLIQEGKLSVGWLPGQREEHLQTALEIVEPIVEVIKSERLLAEDVQVELPLYATLGPNQRIGGRMDMAFSREGAPRIIDFKGSKHKDKRYISDGQLYWYYLLYRAQFGVSPEHLGFWMLRFGYIDWIDSSKEKIEGFLGDVQEAFVNIQQKKFSATPSTKVCAWCLYRNQCDSGDAYQETRPRKQRRPRVELGVDDGLGEDLIIDV